MMNVYFFGYHTDEECPAIPLAHAVYYKKEQFEEICAIAYAKEAKNAQRGATVADFFDRTLQVLLTEYGFSKIEPIAEFSPFGWAAVNKDSVITSSWENNKNKHNDLIKSKFDKL